MNEYLRKQGPAIVREVIISVLISGVVFAGLTYLADLNLANKAGAREFIYEFGRTFHDEPKYRDLSVALEENYLYGKPFVKQDGSKFSDYEIDDYLFLLDNMWTFFYYEGIVPRDVLDWQYSYFFCLTVNSPPIKAYRERLTEEGFAYNHVFLDEVAQEFDLQDKDCRAF